MADQTCTLTPDEIVTLREEGKTYQDIATRAGVSRQRIQQIIVEVCGGDPLGPRPDRGHLSGRVPVELRNAVITCAAKRGETVTEFLERSVTDRLESLGEPVAIEPPYRGEPLPFAE